MCTQHVHNMYCFGEDALHCHDLLRVYQAVDAFGHTSTACCDALEGSQQSIGKRLKDATSQGGTTWSPTPSPTPDYGPSEEEAEFSALDLDNDGVIGRAEIVAMYLDSTPEYDSPTSYHELLTDLALYRTDGN